MTDIQDAIDYFKNAKFSNDNALFLFLLSKHFGISFNNSVMYAYGSLGEKQKTEIEDSVAILGELLDSTEGLPVLTTKEERAGKNLSTIMFPTGFPKNSEDRGTFYQAGSEKAANRVKDTIQKKNLNLSIYKYNEGEVTLDHDYVDKIKNELLNNSKISLKNLAAWIYRFHDFEYNEKLTKVEFSRVIRKLIFKYFHITQKDLTWLFDDDLQMFPLSSPQGPKNLGIKIREYINVSINNEIIQNSASSETKAKKMISESEIENYAELNGDNPSQNTILEILKNKKQIILYGVPGVGKSRISNLIAKDPFFTETRKIQFHANYSYEDFIGGEVLENQKQSKEMQVVSKKGPFLDFIETANNNKPELFIPSKKVVSFHVFQKLTAFDLAYYVLRL
jgi:5-methylcytosine-specific restriction protein B